MPNYQDIAASYATQSNLDPNVFTRQIQQESGFNPSAVSPAGAIGIAQFMPQTAAGLGLNPHDPIASLKAAAAYDARSLKAYNGDYRKMLAAYNAGGGAVNNAVSQYGSNWLAHMPGETQNYVKTILAGKTLASTAPTGTASTPSTGNVILDQLKTWGEYIAIFAISAVLIIIGFFLLAEKQAGHVAKAVLS